MSKKAVKFIKIGFGTFLLALSVEMFILPYDILSGGVAGIAVALEPFFHWNETLWANILTVGFLLLGLFVMGREFIIDSVLSSLLYPVFTTLLARAVPATHLPPAVASLYAGLLGGIGIGIVMSTGASTGGVDIPTIILARALHKKISDMVMIVDGCTVLLGVVAYDLSAALIGLLSVFASTFAVDKVLYAGQSSAKSVQIISGEWKTISSRIQVELERGVTLIDGEGGFVGDPKKMIISVVSARQYGHLLEIIKEIDPHAFVITTDASDMHGEGFTYPSRM